MRHLLTAIILFLSLSAEAQFQGLLINEFSQGDAGSKEYIELLVAGKRTCKDSTADLRGWIVDDQNGWFGTGSITQGHYRFKDVPNWQAVPIGSIILLYNSASNGKNNSITTADDPTDSNKDFTYIVPINSSAYLEEHDNEPSTLSGINYVYPPANSTAGYSGTTNTWTFHIALNNGSDVICTVSPQNRTTHFFSIGYGFPSFPPFKVPTVSVPAVNGGFSCYLSDANYISAGSWRIAAVPANETPGFPNGGANTSWIQDMRVSPKAQTAYVTACSNGPYVFFGQTITGSGAYMVLNNNINGCVDTNQLYVVIKKSETRDTTACDSLIYKGIKYTSNRTIADTIKSLVIDCDSLIKTLRITIKKSSSTIMKACILQGQSYDFNGQTLTSPGHYFTRFVNIQGCDSTTHLFLTVTQTATTTLRGCGTVSFKGVTYTSSTMIEDTTRSILTGCDSLIERTVIQVNSPQKTTLNECAIEGDVYYFNGQPITSSGNYSASFTTSDGCDSTVNLYIVFKKLVVQNFSGCDSVAIDNVSYYQSTTIRDTIRSRINGCDSLIYIKNIQVNQSKKRYLTACTAGASYTFFGQTLTSSGLYSHTLSTSSGCDSLVQLYLVFTKTNTQNLSGCNSVNWNGISYTSSTIIRDTLRSSVTGCDSLIQVIQIEVTKSPVLQISKDTSICRGDSVTLFVTSNSGGSYWEGFGNSNVIRVAPPFTTTFYATAENNGCTASASVKVTVSDFTMEVVANKNPVIPGTDVWLQTKGNLPYKILLWQPSPYFPNQHSLSQRIVADSTIDLMVIGESSGCKDTALLSLQVTPLNDIYIPTGFTPNGDGKNDVVRIVGQGILEMDFKIFNRWGQMVFYTKDQSKGWNGKVGDRLQPTGTYVYSLRAKRTDGKTVERKGVITLIQ